MSYYEKQYVTLLICAGCLFGGAFIIGFAVLVEIFR